jgi:hypothetical protein
MYEGEAMQFQLELLQWLSSTETAQPGRRRRKHQGHIANTQAV